MNPKKEKTFLMIKPDGVQKGLVGEIVKRIEQRDLKIVRLEMFEATRDDIDGHYPKDKEWIERLGRKTLQTYEKYNIDPIEEMGTENEKEIGQQVRGWLLDYLTEAPMVKMIIEGVHAVDMVRKIVGPTMPSDADMGTVRGDFSVDSPTLANKEKRAVRNLVHASETQEEAQHEIEYWFEDESSYNYERFSIDG
ncbi:MAG: nucleoside-diphosphate kinase [Candidatus Magasanikbacteria bacterium]